MLLLPHYGSCLALHIMSLESSYLFLRMDEQLYCANRNGFPMQLCTHRKVRSPPNGWMPNPETSRDTMNARHFQLHSAAHSQQSHIVYRTTKAVLCISLCPGLECLEPKPDRYKMQEWREVHISRLLFIHKDLSRNSRLQAARGLRHKSVDLPKYFTSILSLLLVIRGLFELLYCVGTGIY